VIASANALRGRSKKDWLLWRTRAMNVLTRRCPRKENSTCQKHKLRRLQTRPPNPSRRERPFVPKGGQAWRQDRYCPPRAMAIHHKRV
jgi:hypothetical protein